MAVAIALGSMGGLVSPAPVLAAHIGVTTDDARTGDLVAASTGTVTVNDYENPSLAIEKFADTATYDHVGQIITYHYVITNDGDATISSPFSIDDDNVDVAAVCPPGEYALYPGEGFIQCDGGTYTVTEADLTAGSITNVASATGYDPYGYPVISPTDTVTVTAFGSVFTVNTVDDTDDGQCTFDHCSLREAIAAAEAHPNGEGAVDRIRFDIPGPGPHTIQPATQLPQITDAVIIDGLTQPGASCDSWPASLQVELDGSLDPRAFDGLDLWDADRSVVRGLVINDFYRGINLTFVDDAEFSCNFLGTDANGMAAQPNNYGIYNQQGSRNLIGTYGRNLISGNVFHQIELVNFGGGPVDENRIENNYIGTDTTGSNALGSNNAAISIYRGAGNVVGYNLISGNGGDGIFIGADAADDSDGNAIEYNVIGLDASELLVYEESFSEGSGLAAKVDDPEDSTPQPSAAQAIAVPNDGFGINLEVQATGSVSGTVIAHNVIAANDLGGIQLQGAIDSSINDNQIGINRNGTLVIGNGTGSGIRIGPGILGDAEASSSAVMSNTIAGHQLDGIRILSGTGHSLISNGVYDNEGLGIDLGGDGVNLGDFFDQDTGPNNLQNAPILQRATISGTETLIQGYIFTALTTTVGIQLFANPTCDPSFYGQGQTLLDSFTVNTGGSGYASFLVTLPTALADGTAVTALATAAPTGDTSEFGRCTVVGPNNDSWPNAFPIALQPTGFAGVQTGTLPVELAGSAQQYVTAPGQARWFRFPVEPGSTVIGELTNLPANYDLILFRDIAKTYAELTQPEDAEDLALLGAEFAPEMFSPEMFSPEMFSPEMFSPDMNSPDQRYYASAQARSAVAVSGFDGTADERVVGNSWNENGDFYLRVSGRNGVFNPTAPFNLAVTVLSGTCGGITPAYSPTDTINAISPGSLETLILVDYQRMARYGDLNAMQASLNDLAAAVNGVVVDLGADPAIQEANAQADDKFDCVYAKNVVANAVKEVVDAYRANHPIRYLVIVGNDDIIPFFRYADQALLANESGYVPPVQELTASQASLRLGYVLGQDEYGSLVTVDRKNTTIPVPGIPVGRLVERPDEVIAVVEAFLPGGQVPAPQPGSGFSAFISGYDFLTDSALAVEAELAAGLGVSGSIDTLINPAELAPADPATWTAGDLRAGLLESGRHDLIYLAGHFSAYSSLAADYATRVLASEVAGSPVDMTNSIVFSAGCHSGYSIVNQHGVPKVTVEPDWAQAFARKGAVLIAGTGYQYGDTDFVEYGERLYVEFAGALREGTGPVAVGDALVRAKQIYLAETANMRPIHEKTLLQTTLFGLPMLTIDLPAGRGTTPEQPSIVTNTESFAKDPGLTLGLVYANVTLTPTLTLVDKVFRNTIEGEPDVPVRYYQGEDGQVINPTEPVLPLARYNVTPPQAGGGPALVLRGVGFRGGTYADVLNKIPLTSAAATELRGIHTPFISPVFYPIVPWDVNYFDVLAKDVENGAVTLAVMPFQYRSNSADTIDGTMRTFSDMSFRLYYSNNISDYVNSEAGVTNVPALATPPNVTLVYAREMTGTVQFQATVTGDPSAGMQEVWVTYSALSGPYAGQWQSLDLDQDPADSRLWIGSLPLNGTPADDLRFMVQAVNGVGLHALAINRGRFYVPNVDPGNPGEPPPAPGEDPSPPPEPTTLALTPPPASGAYGTEVMFEATLTAGGTPLADQVVQFGLTSQRKFVRTDASGVAQANLTLAGEPALDTLRVTFDGAPGNQASSASAPFQITPIATSLTLQTTTPVFAADGKADLSIALTDATGRPLREKSVLVVIRNGAGDVAYAETIITNLFGNAELLTLPLAPGTYAAGAYFGSVVALPTGTIDLTNPRYLASEAPPLTITSNTPPTAEAGGPYTVDAGSTVELDASGSSDPNLDQALFYAWDLDGDGSYETQGKMVTFSTATLSGPTTVTVGLRVCDSVDECDTDTADITVDNVTPVLEPLFAILGQEWVWLGANSRVVLGDVGSNSPNEGPSAEGCQGFAVCLDDDVQADAPGTEVLGDSVIVHQGASVDILGYNSAVVEGTANTEITPLALPLIDQFPDVPAFTPGATPVLVPNNGSVTLDAGDYAGLTVGQGATVTFTGGDYSFSLWSVGANVRLDFQQASQVAISGRLRTTSDTYVGPQPGSGLNAGEIKFYVTGSDGPGQPFEDTPKAARFGIRDTVIANVDVPNGTLVLSQGVEATGAFWGLRVRTEPNVKLTLEGGFGDCQVPAAPADVSISALNPSDAQLAWTSRAGYDGAYDVWQSPSPYFRPGEAGSELIGDDVSSPFVAPGVLGDPAVNHYFLVVADGVCSISAPSRLTGEFDFALAPGR